MKTIYECDCDADCGGTVVEVLGVLYFASNTEPMQGITNMDNGYINGEHNVQPEGIDIVQKAFNALHGKSKNRIVEIGLEVFSRANNDLEYHLTVHRQDGSYRSYSTIHVRSIAFDILSDCVNNKEMTKDICQSLSVYPMISYKFKVKR